MIIVAIVALVLAAGIEARKLYDLSTQYQRTAERAADYQEVYLSFEKDYADKRGSLVHQIEWQDRYIRSLGNDEDLEPHLKQREFFTNLKMRLEQEYAPESAKNRARAEYYSRLRRVYEHASSRPWERLPPIPALPAGAREFP